MTHGIRRRSIGELLVLREQARERGCGGVEAAIDRELARQGVVEVRSAA